MPMQRDKAAHPRGAVVTGIDRHRRGLYREHGHRVLTSCLAGARRPGIYGDNHAVLGHWPVGRPDNKMFFLYLNSPQNCKFKSTAIARSKFVHTLHNALFKLDEQLCQLGQLQIPNSFML
jgi:hypothetical protein